MSIKETFRGRITPKALPAAADRPAVKDDLDLAAMARAALNYLRGNPDPARNYECKFSLGPLGIPCHVPLVPPNKYGYDPVSIADTDSRMDTQYANMRDMTGQTEPDPVELGVRRRILGYQREDNLSWANPSALTGKTEEGEWATTWASGKLMMALAENYKRKGDERDREKARAIFLAVKGLASWDGKRAFYPCGPSVYKDGKWITDGWAEQHSRNYPAVVEPCMRYWECCGDQEALDFARAVAEGFLAESQPNMREQRINPETGEFAGHVHLHTHAIWGVAHLGAVLNEKKFLDYASAAYDFVLSKGTDFGWYPEFVPQGEWRTEICVVGDMVSLGAWLARGGQTRRWEDVERTIRNEIERSQFFLTPAFLDLFHKLHADKPREVVEEALGELRKLEGGFVAQAAFDDWVSYTESVGQSGMNANGIQMMGCCPPEGMRAVWEAWRSVVEDRPQGVFVNLALSRDHPSARVTAYRPEAGRLDVEAKKAASFFLRPPAWADRAAVRIAHDGRDTPFRWGGPENAYALCENARPGELFTLSWRPESFTQVFEPASIPDRTQKIAVHWLGNTVVGVEPPGKYLPMFAGEKP